jgi:drug/metabolite transporter (DMT)-like permease
VTRPPLTRAQISLRYLCVAIAAASWGTWPLILRRAEAITPMPAMLESTVVMAVLTVVTGLTATRDRSAVKATRRDWLGVAWLGVGDAANFALFFAAYKVTSVAVAVLTHYLTPIFVALAAPLFLRETATRRTGVAVAIAFAGLVLLLSPWTAAARPGDWLGASLGAASAIFYASNVIMNKRLSVAFSTSELMFFHGLVATPLLALFVPPDAWSRASAHALGMVAAGAVGPGALAGLLFVWGLRALPASHVSTLTLLEPLVAVIIGSLLLGEALAPGAFVGGALILAGALLVVSQRQSFTSDAVGIVER